jgi:hypothetical protein
MRSRKSKQSIASSNSNQAQPILTQKQQYKQLANQQLQQYLNSPENQLLYSRQNYQQQRSN